MVDQLYFSRNEDTDWQKLKAYNKYVGVFKELIPIGGNLHYDASGATYDGRTARIELKTRHFDINKYQSLYIEDHKSANLLYDWITLNDEPLYVNFCDDGIVLFNLRQLTQRPKTSTGRSYSNGYQGWEYNSRNELYLVDATIYDNKYRIKQLSRWKILKRQKGL